MNWGLTETGFYRPTYNEILNALEVEARALYGNGLVFTIRTFAGLTLRIQAWLLNQQFEKLESTFLSRFIGTASGAALNNLVRWVGISRFGAQKSVGYLQVTAATGTVIPAGWLVSRSDGVQYYVSEPAMVDSSGQALLPAYCIIPGSVGNTLADTITIIVNPSEIVAVTDVTNPEPFIGGRDVETDYDLKIRYYATIKGGGINIDGITSYILSTVPGVVSVKGYENDTDTVDSLGNPPHSFQMVVLGGLDTDIANAIFKVKGIGIQSYGVISVYVTTISNQQIPISFSRPQALPVWIQVANLVTNDNYPVDGAAQIADALTNFVNELGIGSPLVNNQLAPVILSVPGVVDFQVTIGTSPSTLGTATIYPSAIEFIQLQAVL